MGISDRNMNKAANDDLIGCLLVFGAMFFACSVIVGLALIYLIWG